MRLSAQNNDTLKFKTQSVRLVGFGFPNVNYSLLSPLNYSGYSFNFDSNRFREKHEIFIQNHINTKLGLLYNDANDSYITSLGVNCGWSRHWRLNDKNRPLLILYGIGADAGIDAYMKEDNTNNPMAYFFNLSISPNILFKYRFNIKNTNLTLWQQIDLPLFSLVSSSDYASSLPSGLMEEDASFFDAMQLVSLGQLKRCLTTTCIDINSQRQQHKKMPVFRITYKFSGMNYNKSDATIKSAEHIFVFGAIFYLFK